MGTELNNRKGARKRPRQARSRATFEAIVEAAEQVICRDGLEDLKTCAVAERAGVSPGSLYQYFNNGEAIVQVIAARKTAQFYAAVVDALAKRHAACTAESSEAVLKALVAEMGSEMPLMQELLQSGRLACDTPLVSAYLRQLTEVLVRGSRRRAQGRGLHSARTRTTFLLATRVVWDSCCQMLLHEPDRFGRGEQLEELKLLTGTLLLMGTFRCEALASPRTAAMRAAVLEAAGALGPAMRAAS